MGKFTLLMERWEVTSKDYSCFEDGPLQREDDSPWEPFFVTTRVNREGKPMDVVWYRRLVQKEAEVAFR